MPGTPTSDRSPADQELIDCVATGTLLNLRQRPSDQRVIHAHVIRDIVLGRHGDVDSRGLRVTGAIIDGALDLENVITDVGVQLFDCEFSAEISLVDAALPILYLNKSTITTRNENGLNALRLRVGDLSLSGATISTPESELGPKSDDIASVILVGATIDGDVLFNDATIENAIGSAIVADGLRTTGSVFLRKVRATGAGEFSTIVLFDATIGRRLDCSEANITNTAGRPALDAGNLHTTGDVYINNKFHAASASEGGAVKFLSATIGGDLLCDDATIENDTGPAIVADGLRTTGNVFLRDAYATSASEGSAVKFLGATIGGNLEFGGATLVSDGDSALAAHNLVVDGNVFFRNAVDSPFEARGKTKWGVVALRRSRISGSLQISHAKLTNDYDPHPATDKHTKRNDGASVDLSGTRVNDVLTFEKITHENPHGAPLLNINGLTYTGVPETAEDEPTWLERIRHDTGSYRAQPYQQLAAAHGAEGHDADQRKVLMAQRKDQIRRGTLPWRDRQWARFTGLALGYGYQPWRMLVALLLTMVIGVGLAVGMGANDALAASSGDACSVMDRVGVGIDVSVPLVTTGSQDRCVPAETGAGQGFIVFSWLLQALGWAFATLFVAGFTKAVRKT